MLSAVPMSVFRFALLWLKRMQSSGGDWSWLFRNSPLTAPPPLARDIFLRELPRVDGSLWKECSVAVPHEAGSLPRVITNHFNQDWNRNHLERIFQICLSEPHFQKCSARHWYVFSEKAFWALICAIHWESSITWVFELFSFFPSLRFSGLEFG